MDASKNKQNRVKSNFTQFKAKPDSWGFRKFVDTTALKGRASPAQWLPNDSLTIVCDVSIIGAERLVSGSKYPEESLAKNQKPKQNRHKQLSVDLEHAFHHKEFCDVQVKCGEKTFDCHQFMLSAR